MIGGWGFCSGFGWLQTETGPTHEALDRSDRFLDPAGTLANTSLDIEQQQAAQVVRRLGESAPRQRHAIGWVCCAPGGKRKDDSGRAADTDFGCG